MNSRALLPHPILAAPRVRCEGNYLVTAALLALGDLGESGRTSQPSRRTGREQAD
jgi:hypothetical protein